MEKNNQCPKMEKCPVFLKNILHSEKMNQTYKQLYCLADEMKYKTCKRYQISEKYGKPAPDNVLPNSSMSIEEIAKRMNLL